MSIALCWTAAAVNDTFVFLVVSTDSASLVTRTVRCDVFHSWCVQVHPCVYCASIGFYPSIDVFCKNSTLVQHLTGNARDQQRRVRVRPMPRRFYAKRQLASELASTVFAVEPFRCVAFEMHRMLPTKACHEMHLKNEHGMNTHARRNHMGRVPDARRIHRARCSILVWVLTTQLSCTMSASISCPRTLRRATFTGRAPEVRCAFRKIRPHNLKLDTALRRHHVSYVPDCDEEITIVAQKFPLAVS